MAYFRYSFILKHIAKYTVTQARRQLRNQTLELSSSSLCMHEALQTKGIYLYMIFKLNNGVRHRARVLCPDTNPMKFSSSFIFK